MTLSLSQIRFTTSSWVNRKLKSLEERVNNSEEYIKIKV